MERKQGKVNCRETENVEKGGRKKRKGMKLRGWVERVEKGKGRCRSR